MLFCGNNFVDEGLMNVFFFVEEEIVRVKKRVNEYGVKRKRSLLKIFLIVG